MKRIFSVIVLIICLPLIGFGQTDNYTKSANAAELCDVMKGNSFSTYQNADLALDKILSVTGMSKRFVLKECNGISNCIATEFNGIRYILYDKYFMDDIAENSSSWTNLAILAHEIGHHVNGHSLDLIVAAVGTANAPSLSESRQRELEADQFSGFVLQKLGASLYQAQEAIRILSSNADDSYSTHPSRYKRLAAIERGYNKSKGVNTNNDSQNSNSSLTAEDYFYKAYNSSDYNYQIANYTSSIRLDPDYYEAYYNRGAAYLYLEEYRSAISDFTSAIRLDPDDPDAYYNRGQSYFFLDEYRSAISDYTSAIRLNPDYALAYYNRGAAYLYLEEHRSAISDCISAIKLNPDFAIAYYLRGIVYDQIGNQEIAAADYSKALELDPTYFDAAYNLGAIYYNIGVDWNNKASNAEKMIHYKEASKKANEFFALAKPALEKAHKIDPEDRNTIASLVKIYAIEGNGEKYSEMKKKLNN